MENENLKDETAITSNGVLPEVKPCAWISVDERLPDDLSYHLIAWKVEEVTGSSYAMCEIYKDKKWYRYPNNFPQQLDNVTHWMPFPKPPCDGKV
jgi:hypothetical protein